MKILSPQKIFVQYREGISPTKNIVERKYTITHSDITADLFVFIAKEYADDQFTEMRDEVLLEWEELNQTLSLTGKVLVDGPGVTGNAFIRNKIFIDEMPTALQALRKGDRFLFEDNPQLDNTPVLIWFISSKPMFNKVYNFGLIGQYK